MNEQELVTLTTIHLGFIDRIKILFGAIIEVKLSVYIPMEVESYNGTSDVKIISGSKYKFEKDLPNYGYMEVR